ncbi:nucleotide exchange factor GrpE [Patescibacteria group bacterium]|nr:nucleotide exchange factor GrpE [Patescibacteria group bacterium]
MKQEENKNKSKTDLLAEQIINLEKERDEYLNGWKRTKADYINLQTSGLKQIEQIVKFGNQKLIEELLSVLDSLELSIIATKDKEAQKGIETIYSQLEKILKDHGLEKIKALGEKFNPSLHEAISQEESEKESGTILEELVKGWKLNDKAIRPTKVKIAK